MMCLSLRGSAFLDVSCSWTNSWTYKSIDGLVRSIKFNTATGTYERPITKLCISQVFYVFLVNAPRCWVHLGPGYNTCNCVSNKFEFSSYGGAAICRRMGEVRSKHVQNCGIPTRALHGQHHRRQSPVVSNSEKYIQILETIIPSIRATAIHAPNPIRFFHDKSSIHTSALVRNWFAQHPDIQVIVLPTKGCDVNVIENVWAMMQRTWDIQDERHQAAIVNHATAEWENLRRLPNYCQRLVDSVPDRLNTIIEANGGWGKY
ncbi:uncharacterized protein LOC122244682 [Penaeus japonicus]|uniref:uncharacterized protein LOC122244682 n=1 Tax=Penaeus japonicus TaxID=27405 RepID=UPI001C70E0FB|nr:uncharacterized protein LOC122244682 [Penaeus japonicus]